MFAGHDGGALGAKGAVPLVPLWVLTPTAGLVTTAVRPRRVAPVRTRERTASAR